MTISILKIVGCILTGYLLGCVSPAYILGKLTVGQDIRKHGSGNAGTTNIIRTIGLKTGLLVFFMDVLKGVAAFLLGSMISNSYVGGILCGVAAVIGHDFPIFLGFHGAKAFQRQSDYLFRSIPRWVYLY